MARLLRLEDVRASAEGEQPDGYRLLRRGQLNLGLLSLLSLGLMVPAFLFFVLITAPLGGPLDPGRGWVRPRFGPVDVLLVSVAGLVVLPVIHELIHGAVAALCRGRPVYGIGPGVAFCHFRELVGRRCYAAILVAPLVVISVVGVALVPLLPAIFGGPLLALLVSNAAGAVGDVAALLQLRGLPADALIADTRDGFEVYTRMGGTADA